MEDSDSWHMVGCFTRFGVRLPGGHAAIHSTLYCLQGGGGWHLRDLFFGSVYISCSLLLDGFMVLLTSHLLSVTPNQS